MTASGNRPDRVGGIALSPDTSSETHGENTNYRRGRRPQQVLNFLPLPHGHGSFRFACRTSRGSIDFSFRDDVSADVP